jgi:predicted metal-dependent hydrolase
MAHKGPRIRQPGAQEVAAATLQELLPAENDSLDFVRHPRARRYVLRVRADGTVRVTIPRGGSRREGGAFAERERTWIEAERRRLALERARPREDVPAELEKSLRNQATRELPVRVFELAAQHSLQVTRVSVRNQRWRWGSCSRSGHICLNWRLVQMPAAVRDYVIVHELMHLKRMDHSPRFWRLVAEVCPDYLAARAWLREHGRSSS